MAPCAAACCSGVTVGCGRDIPGVPQLESLCCKIAGMLRLLILVIVRLLSDECLKGCILEDGGVCGCATATACPNGIQQGRGHRRCCATRAMDDTR